ncbi:MAG: flagellar biosynthesis protein FlhF [Treponema sp.]|jgi:flagellar biosynthesis protein FlhF|nr:flagellar biosynthesis protein FlhF [Treponema sp.]
MEQFTEQAYDWDECLDKIREKYGDNYQILRQKAIRMGGFLGLFTRQGIEVSGYIPSRYGKSGSGPLGYQQSKAGGMVSGGGEGSYSVPRRESGLRGDPGSRNEPLDFEEAKRKVLAAAGKDPAIQQVLSTVREIKEKIEQIDQAAQPAPEEHPNLQRLRELFDINDFLPSYREKVFARIKKECSLETLEDFDALQDAALVMIGEDINIFREKSPLRSPRVMILVGPTGVGKTTTIAKLAAVYGLPNPAKTSLRVRMITIDSLRIGARNQIEAYGEIMGIPVAYVDSQEELRKTMALFSEGVDLILIDTFGKSPRDAVKLGEMKRILDACGSRAELYLTIMASTKTSDLQDILRQFEPFGYQSVIITKVDETMRMGNIISVLAEKGKSVSYITTGQTVPTDIQRADVVRLLCCLEGFKVKWEKMEERFPVNKYDEIQWGR